MTGNGSRLHDSVVLCLACMYSSTNEEYENKGKLCRFENKEFSHAAALEIVQFQEVERRRR